MEQRLWRFPTQSSTACHRAHDKEEADDVEEEDVEEEDNVHVVVAKDYHPMEHTPHGHLPWPAHKP